MKILIDRILSDGNRLKDDAVKITKIAQDIDEIMNDWEEHMLVSEYMGKYQIKKEDINQFTELISDIGECFISAYALYENTDNELLNKFCK